MFGWTRKQATKRAIDGAIRDEVKQDYDIAQATAEDTVTLPPQKKVRLVQAGKEGSHAGEEDTAIPPSMARDKPAQEKPPLKVSRAHNSTIRNFPKVVPNLLNFPLEVRIRIYRNQVVYDGHQIAVSASEPNLCESPNLVLTNSEIRRVALPIFYRENNFLVHVEDYDIERVLPWLKQADVFRRPDETWAKVDSEHLAVLGEVTECPGKLELTVDGDPHWENLVQWLRLAHRGEVAPLSDNSCTDVDQQTIVVKAVFTAVMGLQAHPWATVQSTLPGLREMLAASKISWGWEPMEPDDDDEAALAEVEETEDTVEATATAELDDVEESDTLEGGNRGPEDDLKDEESEAIEEYLTARQKASQTFKPELPGAKEEVQALHWDSDMDDSGVDHANGMW